ncbi:hypothetical protein ACQK5W_12000 [Pantoea sp. FN060301]|uniref:hypothetical protein n=1 Tax=Pantoea sp. FN060301 TaxID=3420380 RepID=UPI003D183F79
MTTDLGAQLSKGGSAFETATGGKGKYSDLVLGVIQVEVPGLRNEYTKREMAVASAFADALSKVYTYSLNPSLVQLLVLRKNGLIRREPN